MPTAYKKKQIQGSASTGTFVTLYEVPASTEAVISSIVICNTAAATATYRIGFDDTAGTPNNSEWLVYDAVIAANDTVCLTLGICSEAGKFIRVASSANTVTFSLFVSEIS